MIILNNEFCFIFAFSLWYYYYIITLYIEYFIAFVSHFIDTEHFTAHIQDTNFKYILNKNKSYFDTYTVNTDLHCYYNLFQLCLDLDHNNCNYLSNYYHIHCSQTVKHKRWSRRSKVQILCCPKDQN